MSKSLYPIPLPLSRRKTRNWCLKNNAVIARPVRTLVVAIPRLERKYSENFQEDLDSPRFLVVIVTWFHSSGGLPRQCAHWLAMTGNLQCSLQAPIYRTKGLPGVFGEALRGSICFPAGFPCARIESRGAWDPRLPRGPAFFLLPSWHSPRVQYAPDGGNHARSGEELLQEQLLHSLESPRREGAFQVRLLQKCQEIGLPGIQVP